ncbi:MAG: Stk1 family PASTA domain-containing Ser/Thr kinase [Cellulomonadaceae bacterium]|jgi:serine/threonine-protein kinase|nr:Stk1 family PASTA domain-containing Ser/Thr kinase [Cellulomonadaceae bacterium]
MDNAPRVLANRYEVGELIGRGGMAEVHIGHDARLGRTVAIKVLRADLARDPSFLARFRREAQSAAALNHPAIVAVYDTGEDKVTDPATGAENPLPFIVMEYVEGHTVRDILRNGSAVPIDEAVEITEGILSALEYSHHAGIIHRDIKPANVMITPTGAVKVMDFGIARAVADSAATMTQTQAVIGTAQYLSPEQARGETVDARSDLYSTGCVFFELLTGRPPFIGDSPVAVAYQHVGQPPVAPSSVASDVPPVLDRIALKALTKDRDQRYSTAAEFHQDLENALHGGVVSADVVDPASTALLGATAADATMAMDASNDATRVIGTAQTGAVPAAGVAGAAMAAGAATGQFGSLGQPVSTPAEGVPTVAEEAAARKKKRLIVASIIAGIFLLGGGIAWAVMHSGDDTPPPTEQVTVPTIAQGMTQEAACQRITDAGLECTVGQDTDSNLPTGTFTGQDPAGGTEVDKGSTVTVNFSAGPTTLAVPDLTGKTEDDAKAALEDVGLVLGNVNTETSVSVANNQVTRSDPQTGMSIDRGQRVDIYLSNGMVDLPNLVGQTEAQASGTLQNLQLTARVETVETADTPEGSVAEQSPAAGTVPQRSSVTIRIAKAPATPTVTIPDVVGRQWNDVSGQFGDLDPRTSTDFSDTIAAGAVISTDPPAGTTVDKGTRVSVVTSTGPKPQPSPSPTPTPTDDAADTTNGGDGNGNG